MIFAIIRKEQGFFLKMFSKNCAGMIDGVDYLKKIERTKPYDERKRIIRTVKHRGNDELRVYDEGKLYMKSKIVKKRFSRTEYYSDTGGLIYEKVNFKCSDKTSEKISIFHFDDNNARVDVSLLSQDAKWKKTIYLNSDGEECDILSILRGSD